MNFEYWYTLGLLGVLLYALIGGGIAIYSALMFKQDHPEFMDNPLHVRTFAMLMLMLCWPRALYDFWLDEVRPWVARTLWPRLSVIKGQSAGASLAEVFMFILMLPLIVDAVNFVCGYTGGDVAVLGSLATALYLYYQRRAFNRLSVMWEG